MSSGLLKINFLNVIPNHLKHELELQFFSDLNPGNYFYYLKNVELARNLYISLTQNTNFVKLEKDWFNLKEIFVSEKKDFWQLLLYKKIQAMILLDTKTEVLKEDF